MQINWNYLWRTVVFHLMWLLISPIAGIVSAVRTRGFYGAWVRMKLVYASVYQKFVIRPRLNRKLRNIADEDLETLLWLSRQYPVSLQEAADIWEANGRMVGATIKEIEYLKR